MTFGLPMVIASPPRNSLAGCSAAVLGRASVPDDRRRRPELPGQIEQVGNASPLDGEEDTVERMGEGRQPDDREGQPDDVPDGDPGRERHRALGAPSENPRHDGGDARSRRRGGDEEGGGEDDKAGEIHDRSPADALERCDAAIGSRQTPPPSCQPLARLDHARGDMQHVGTAIEPGEKVGVGARHPDLAAEGLERREKAGAAARVEMGRDLVEKHERRDARSCCRRAAHGPARGR